MAKAAFVGFGEVNTPIDLIIRKCAAAEKALKEEGLDLLSVYPVTDDYEEKDVNKAIAALKGQEFDCLEPQNEPFIVKAETVYNEKNEEIESAPHPMMTIKIPFDKPVKAGSLLRMKAD